MNLKARILFLFFSCCFALEGYSQTCGTTPYTLTNSTVDVLCNGGASGSATVSVSGGVGPFTYSWSPTGGTNATATGLTAGSYSCTVTDVGQGENCVANMVIIEPSAISVSPLGTVNASCFGNCDGSIIVSVAGGTSGYSLQWLDATLSPIGQTTNNASNLCAGDYYLQVTDANGCITQAGPFTVSEPSQIVANATAIDENCAGACDGSVSVSPTGGVGGYAVSWEDGAMVAFGTAYTEIDLCPDTYTATVTDANGCTAQGVAVVNAFGGTPLSASVVVEHDTCGQITGSATITGAGGSPPYTYTLVPGPGNATGVFNNLSTGTYNYAVDDANGCTYQGSFTILTFSQIVLTTSFTEPLCNGDCNGSVTVSVSGATAPYTIEWYDGATLIGTNATVNNLCAGTYDVVVYDNSSCQATAQVTLTEPSPLSLNVTGMDASDCVACDGVIASSPTGGTAGYIYVWSNGMTTSGAGSLCPGTYYLDVTDVNGCNAQDSVTIGPDPSNMITPVMGGMCSDAAPFQMQASVPGGLWSASCGTCINATSGFLDPAVAGPGTHVVSYTVFGNCVDDEFVTIYDVPAVAVSQMSPSCGQCDGQLDAVVSGGTPVYSYAWSPGTNLSNASILDPLLCEPASTTNYTLTVVDVNGCVGFDQLTVIAGAPCDSVFPGDTDYDGIADNNDLLPIGFAWGATGSVRAGASLNWVGQVAANWLDTVPGGVDYKHSDTDGNGLVNDDDTTAILTNYGYVHAGGGELPKAGGQDPDLYFDLSLDTAGINQSLQVPLYYGTAAMPVDSVYGLAFTINFDPTLVDTTQPIYLDMSNNWIGTNGVDVLHIQYLIENAGELDVALTRTNGNPISGFGILGELNVVTTDNLSGLQEAEYKNLYFWISDLKILNHRGDELFANAIVDTVVITDLYDGVSENNALANLVQMYPNPARDYTIVNAIDGKPLDRISILDMAGREVRFENGAESRTRVSLAGLPAGSYLMRLERDGQYAHYRLEIIR